MCRYMRRVQSEYKDARAKFDECSAGVVGQGIDQIESDVPSVVSAPNETCSTRTADHAASTAAAKISMR
jgi:hypothetical protein